MKYLLIAIIWLSSTVVWAGDASIVRLTRADGTVEVLKYGSSTWQPLKEGAVIERGDRVAARDKSAAVLIWSNGSVMRIYPNSEVELAGVTFDLDRKLEKTYLELHNGRLFIKAQVPEHLFTDFSIKIGAFTLRTQGAEFALKYDPASKSYTAWSLLGRLISDFGDLRVRIDDGTQATLREGGKLSKQDIVPIADNVKNSLAKTSRDLGGSLLGDESLGPPGGKLIARIGGMTNRRGNSPFTVNFKALTGGGSGKIKSIEWNFGDGESSSANEVEHTFTQGLYAVTLKVTDESGQTASAQVGISVEEDCGC